jgi:hypothetical protein
VAVSVARKYNPQTTWRQCTLATQVLGQNGLDCCSPGSNCNKAKTLSEAFAKTGHLDGQRFLNPNISFEQVCDEIRDDQPFCVRIEWPEDPLVGHFVAVTGFSVGPNGEQYLDVQDPSDIDSATDNMKRQIPFEQCKTNYDKRRGKWTWLYKTTA